MVDVFHHPHRDNPTATPSEQIGVTENSFEDISKDVSKDLNFDGMPVEQAARQLGLTQNDIWNMVRAGQLLARSDKGRLLVYTHELELPPLLDLPEPPQVPALRENFMTQNTELSLLIDHLSLSKEENREILKLTQDAMAHLSKMSSNVIQMKDKLLEVQEQQIVNLRTELAETKKKIAGIAQQSEDWETLAKALQTEQP